MEATKAKVMVQGNSCTKSPKGPVIILVMGKNMPEMAKVASDIGTKSCEELVTAEYQRE